MKSAAGHDIALDGLGTLARHQTCEEVWAAQKYDRCFLCSGYINCLSGDLCNAAIQQ